MELPEARVAIVEALHPSRESLKRHIVALLEFQNLLPHGHEVAPEGGSLLTDEPELRLVSLRLPLVERPDLPLPLGRPACLQPVLQPV